MKTIIERQEFNWLFHWHQDKDGDHQLSIKLEGARSFEYWGMICPHHGDYRVFADGRAYVPFFEDLDKAKREVECWAASDFARQRLEIKTK